MRRSRRDRPPDLHAVFAEDGFLPKTVEVDSDQDGRVDQIFIYEGDRLTAEKRDTDLDGNLDCFEHFDERGALSQRDEDFDEDGEIDVRTNYRSGRMVHRVIVNPEAAKIP